MTIGCGLQSYGPGSASLKIGRLFWCSNSRPFWRQNIVRGRNGLREGDRLEFVPVDTVDWIESANNYVVLQCGPKQHVLAETLTNLDKSLNHDKFPRIHRRRIVNGSRVDGAR